MKRQPTPYPIRTTLIYAVFGALWILLSDSALDTIVPHTSPMYTQAQTIKGWAFILVSATLLYFVLMRDARILRKHEDEQRESQAVYRQLFDNNPQRMWVYDRETLKFLMVNDAAIARYGFTHAEFMDMTIKDIRPPEEVSALLENLAQPPTTLEKSTGWQHRKKDGTLMDVEISSHSIQLEGKSARMVLVNDITERKKAEEQLRQSEERFRLMAENIEEGFWITDLSNNSEIYLSPATERIFGRNIKDLIQKPDAFLESILPEDHALVLANLQKQGQGETTSMEYRIRHTDGSIRWIWDRAFPVLKKDGTAVIVTGLVADITERKEAEARIQTQLMRLSGLNAIDRAISSSVNMHVSLDVLLSEVISQLGVDAASVLLFNNTNQRLEFVAGRGFRSSAIHQSQAQLGNGLAGQAGLERKVVHVSDLPAMGASFQRRDLLKDEDFIEYFGVPLIAKGQLKGVFEIFNRNSLEPDPEWLSCLETLGGQAAIAIDNAQLFKGLQQSNQELTLAYDATIAGWSHAMDLRDQETEGHTRRVMELTLKLAERMGIPPHEQLHIRRGALLHDIGKLGVPDQILLKPGKLTDEEWAIMRRHPAHAYDMLTPINYLRPALDIPYCHHEKWDGSGYPRGLKGGEIPFPARIFAVVDVWDALRSDRPYRESWSAQMTRDYIRAESGKHFEPRVVDAFLALLYELPDLE